jgi:hypothetical protein
MKCLRAEPSTVVFWVNKQRWFVHDCRLPTVQAVSLQLLLPQRVSRRLPVAQAVSRRLPVAQTISRRLSSGG